MANPRESRTHLTILRLNLPVDSINIGSVGFGGSFGLVRRSGWGEEDAWQLSISGAVFAQFNLDAYSTSPPTWGMSFSSSHNRIQK